MAIRHLLTNREIEVMNYIVYDDLTPDKVAKALKIKPATVNWVLCEVRDKYKVQSTLEAVVKYIKEKHGIESTAKEENKCVQGL